MKRLGLVFVIAILGCGGGSSVTLDQFPVKAATAVCAQNFKCCDATELAGKTMSDCVNNNESFLALFSGTISDSQAKGRASYSATQMGTCISGISALSCAEWKAASDPMTSPSCTAAITAKVASGGACQQDYECTTGKCVGATVDANQNPVDGMCGPADPTVAIGQPCTSGGASCVSGAYCDSTSNTCKAQKAAGESCDPTGTGAECANSCDSTTSTCTCYVGCSVAGPVTGAGALWSLALLAAAIAAARLRRARLRRVGRSAAPPRGAHRGRFGTL